MEDLKNELSVKEIELISANEYSDSLTARYSDSGLLTKTDNSVAYVIYVQDIQSDHAQMDPVRVQDTAQMLKNILMRRGFWGKLRRTNERFLKKFKKSRVTSLQNKN